MLRKSVRFDLIACFGRWMSHDGTHPIRPQ
jgi:hypothetical protein